MRSILGAVLGILFGYLAAMAIAAVFPFDTGLRVRDTSLMLALVCCGCGAVFGGLIGWLAGQQSRAERH